jgi:OOP family OmpA-OmpF porin
MTKQSNVLPLSRAALAVSLALLAGAAGAAGAAPGYVTSASGGAVTNATGLCWRTTDWTPINAAAPCDAVPQLAVAPVPPPVVEAPKPPEPVAVVPLAPAPVIQRITLSTDVLFRFDSAQLRPGAHEKLDELAQTMQGAEVDRIVAIGHADRIASEKYNKELSEKRAQAVSQYLAQKGVDPQRVQVEGRGESESITQCTGLGPERGSNQKLVSCLQPDRRVEIEVLGHREVAGGTGTPSSSGASGAAGTSPSDATSGSGSGSGSGSSGSSTR